MKLTLLVENNSLYNTYYIAEHGFSAYMEDAGKKIVYDTGYSDAFIKNAEKMGIDLTAIDFLILSHGHLDHACGIRHLVTYYKKKGLTRKPVLMMVSPDAFLRKYDFELQKDQGMDVDRETLEAFFDVQFVSEPVHLTERLIYLGAVERNNAFECQTPQKAKQYKDGEWIDDFILEDTQLCYKHGDNQVSVITGCSHNGICNIIEYAKKVTGADQVDTVIGGLHLQCPSKPLLDATLGYIRKAGIRTFYPCHDTDFRSRIALAEISNVEEAGVSLTLEWD